MSDYGGINLYSKREHNESPLSKYDYLLRDVEIKEYRCCELDNPCERCLSQIDNHQDGK